jgi:hypothetical protein
MDDSATSTTTRPVLVQAIGLLVAGLFLVTMVFLSPSQGWAVFSLVGAVLLLGGGLYKLAEARRGSSTTEG